MRSNPWGPRFNPTEAYLVNEGVLDNTTWLTRLAHVSLP
jgi:hypothetical protein